MKRRLLHIFVIASIAFSCDDSDDPGPNERSFAVSSFNAVDIGGNAVVRFDSDVSGNNTVIVKGKPEQVGEVNITVVNNTLLIKAPVEVGLQDSLTIIVNPLTLASITLEADQKAAIYWDGNHDVVLDFLDIKTEANSMLGISNLRADNINIQQEAQSKIQLESWFKESIDSLAVLKSEVVVMDETGYVVTEDGVIAFKSFTEVEKDGKVYLVIRDVEVKRFFIVPYVTAKLEATSELFADELPIRNLDIRLEGESTAIVWVIERLSGKGEGKSSLFYIGAPQIEYITEGGATINKY